MKKFLTLAIFALASFCLKKRLSSMAHLRKALKMSVAKHSSFYPIASVLSEQGFSNRPIPSAQR